MGLEGGEEEWEDEKVEVLKESKSGMEEREKEAEQIGQTKGRRAACGRAMAATTRPTTTALRRTAQKQQTALGWVGEWEGPWEGFPFLSVGQSSREEEDERKGWCACGQQSPSKE